jgi:hypothetical protein
MREKSDARHGVREGNRGKRDGRCPAGMDRRDDGIDGPFAPSRDMIAGFWLWEVQDIEEAVAWGKRCPNPMPVPSEIEIRPLHR